MLGDISFQFWIWKCVINSKWKLNKCNCHSGYSILIILHCTRSVKAWHAYSYPSYSSFLLYNQRIIIHVHINQGSHRLNKISFHGFSMTFFSIFHDHLCCWCCDILWKTSENANFLHGCLISKGSKKHTNFIQFGGEIGKIPWLLANFACYMTFPWPFSFSMFFSLCGNPCNRCMWTYLKIKDRFNVPAADSYGTWPLNSTERHGPFLKIDMPHKALLKSIGNFQN